MTVVGQRVVEIGAEVPGCWRLDTSDLALSGYPVSLVLVFDRPAAAERLANAIRAQLVRYPIFHAVLEERDQTPFLICTPGSTREATVSITILQRDDLFRERSTEERYEQ